MAANWSARPGVLGAPSAPSARSPFSTHRSSLPLNLVAMILDFVDEAADLAALTRTSKIMYYMALPKLYDKISLRSYSQIQYENGRPKGIGNGSPFAVGLSALVGGSAAQYARRFYVSGDWTSATVDDYLQGQVPDADMMLNVSMRAAIDKMARLEDFRWEFNNTKPLHAVYSGLAQRTTLRTLVIKFPTTRFPRPQVTIPGMPSLKTLVAYEIDPICFPDDIATLLSDSRQLESVVLHWNPRVRNEQDHAMNAMHYFGRCIELDRPVRAKYLAFYNLYAPTLTMLEFNTAFVLAGLTSISFVNAIVDDPRRAFADRAYRARRPENPSQNLRFYRGDVIDVSAYNHLELLTGLEEVYYVGTDKIARSTSTPSSNSTPSVASSGGGSGPTLPTYHSRGSDWVSVASSYVAALQTNHAHSIRNLLLFNRWVLSLDVICALVARCPRLRQFGAASGTFGPDLLSRIARAAPRLVALKIVFPPDSDVAAAAAAVAPGVYEAMLAREVWRPEYANLRFFGLGDRAFEFGEVVEGGGGGGGGGGMGGPLRVVRAVALERVMHLGIWRYDTGEMVNSDILG